MGKTKKTELEFWDIVHEIRDLAEEGMTAKDRRKFKNTRSALLGGKVRAN